MSTIQFEAVVKDDTIRIPEQYRAAIRKGRVHVMLTDAVHEPVDKTRAGTLTLDDFMELRLTTKGFKFDREEANVRC